MMAALFFVVSFFLLGVVYVQEQRIKKLNSEIFFLISAAGIRKCRPDDYFAGDF